MEWFVVDINVGKNYMYSLYMCLNSNTPAKSVAFLSDLQNREHMQG